MIKSILLINCNQTTTPYPVYPLGLSHVGAALENVGYLVNIYDIQVDTDTIAERISSFNPNLVGLSLRNIDDTAYLTQTFFADALIDIAKEVKAITDVPIVCGGSGYSLYPKILLEKSCIDYGITGEGEYAFVNLINALNHNGDIASIPGVVWRDTTKTIHINQNLLKDIVIAPTALRPTNLTSYYIEKSSMLNIQTQRGCGFKCCYCTYPVIEGTRFRFRPASDVCDDIERIQKSGAGYFFIVDSVFNTSKDHVKNVCEEIIRRNIIIEWGCFLRPQNIDSELMMLMSRAGLQHIEFGSDSLCDSVLESYGKYFTFDDILSASEEARKANVHYTHFLIVGGPGENEATMTKSYENAKQIRKTSFFPFIGMRIYPGTPLYKIALDNGIVNPKDDLLKPSFYISPNITYSRIEKLLEQFSQEKKNWIYGEESPEMKMVQNRLRAKGIKGPLWEFLAQ